MGDYRFFGVSLSFLVQKDGTVANINILNSSGYSILDRSAVKTITKISPLLAFPEKLEQSSIDMKVRILFVLAETLRG